MSANLTLPPSNEADFEARVRAAIKKAFPHTNIDIQHQVRFKFQVGKEKIEIDGKRNWVKEGRADIVLTWQGRPLAVLELKRKDLKLRDEDRLQGQSYARILDQIAPLVIVTNGSDTKIYNTYNGAEWAADSDIDQQVKKLFENACLLAEEDTRHAVRTLMGRDCDVWSSVVNESTAETLKLQTGELHDILLPFARDFLIPRQATQALIRALERTHFVILEGEPLAGKSSVLREVIATALSTNSFTALYIEDGGAGYFQCLADTLGRTLGWDLTAEEARGWLLRLIPNQDKKLAILIDHYRSSSETSKRELEDLVGIANRSGFSVVVAVDDALVDDLISSPNARARSSLGRLSERVIVSNLSDKEFELAANAAGKIGVKMMEGSFRSDNYRRPWILRSVICNAKNKPTGGQISCRYNPVIARD